MTSHRSKLTPGMVSLCLILLVFSGCGMPSEPYVKWAPDGQHAFVQSMPQTEDGEPFQHMVVDAAGNIVSPLSTTGPELVLDWMPDSRHAIIADLTSPKNWSDYKTLLDNRETATITAAGADLAQLLRQYQGPLSTFGESPAVKEWRQRWQAGDTLQTQVGYYLRQTQPKLIEPLLLALRNATKHGKKSSSSSMFDDESNFQAHVVHLLVRDIITAHPAPDRILTRTTDFITWASVSANNKAVAFVESDFETAPSKLMVMKLSAYAKPVLVGAVSLLSSEAAAWSPNGRDLAYIEMEQNSAGTLMRRTVCDAAGNVLSELKDPTRLADVVLPFQSNVAWLPDGRIIFASQSIRLPYNGDAFLHPQLFVVKPEPFASIMPALASSAQQFSRDIDVADFALSPDGKRIAFSGYDNGAVYVLALDDGSITQLQTPFKIKDQTVPSWKSATELSYVVPAEKAGNSPGRAQLVIADQNGKRMISTSWPDVSFLRATAASK